MKVDFPALWAESPSTLRREPTNAEMAGGFPCGDLDINLFNELFYRLAQIYREMANATGQNGQSPSPSVLDQLSKAIRRPLFAVDTGTPNHLVLPILSWDSREGCLITARIGANNTNTGATDVAIGGTAALPLTYPDGSALGGGELVAGREAVLLTTPTGVYLIGSAKQIPSVALVHSGAASGSATALIVDVTPSITAYEPGALYSITMPSASGNGGTTANLDNLGVRSVRRADGLAIQQGDWGAGSQPVFSDNGTELRLVGSGAAAATAAAATYITSLSIVGGRLKTFTDPGAVSWLCPENVTKIRLTLQAGGGGGGGAEGSGGGAGGDGGNSSVGVYDVTPGTTYTGVVGAGGAGGPSSGGGPGQPGGSTYLGPSGGSTFRTVLGGCGGGGTTGTSSGTAGVRVPLGTGPFPNGGYERQGNRGQDGLTFSNAENNRAGGSGGGSQFSANTFNAAGLGSPGASGPGGAGGGGVGSSPGGNGAAGLIFIEY